MSENVKVRWLTDHEGTKVAPKTLSSQVYNDDGSLLKDKIDASIENAVNGLNETITNKADKTDIVQADWNQNDETALDYVKNRTHYEEVKKINIEEMEFAIDSISMGTEEEIHGYEIPFELGQIWNIAYVVDTSGSVNTDYQNLEVKQAEDGTLYIGDYPNVNDIPFYITPTTIKSNSSWVYMIKPSNFQLIGVSGYYTLNETHPLDEKYLPETVATKGYVEELYTKLNSNTILGFYCVEDVEIITNGISKIYPANSNVQISFIEGDTFEIIPTSDKSILTLTAYPGALGTYYSWLEGVQQFSNILFDMNAEDMYTKWSQGNQGAYRVQFAQYVNCIFWSDNPYISDVSKRTNYTLFSTSQLPLCYSTIPDNTFKAFYLAFGVNSDPNWSNPAYTESFAKATWATQVFSYYGARVVGFPGHLDIMLPKDCRGLMFDARNIECAGTFDATNTTNFGAKSGSWREAFGECTSLRRLYIKNLKVNLNISWSPVDYNSISYIIEAATNTSKITISVSPYTYNLLSDADFELATSKNITIALLEGNYVEDKRLGQIANKADKSYIDEALTAITIDEINDIWGVEDLMFDEEGNVSVLSIFNDATITDDGNGNVVIS